MANLTLRSIFWEGRADLGEGMGPAGEDIFDWYRGGIDLSGFVDKAALLLLATRGVHWEENFITFNAPPEVARQSNDKARGEPYYVQRILPNPSDTWILQVHRVSSGILKEKDNCLGIHSRNKEGKPVENRDDFSVARIFLLYFGSE